MTEEYAFRPRSQCPLDQDPERKQVPERPRYVLLVSDPERDSKVSLPGQHRGVAQAGLVRSAEVDWAVPDLAHVVDGHQHDRARQGRARRRHPGGAAPARIPVVQRPWVPDKPEVAVAVTVCSTAASSRARLGDRGGGAGHPGGDPARRRSRPRPRSPSPWCSTPTPAPTGRTKWPRGRRVLPGAGTSNSSFTATLNDSPGSGQRLPRPTRARRRTSASPPVRPPRDLLHRRVPDLELGAAVDRARAAGGLAGGHRRRHPRRCRAPSAASWP